MSSSENRLASRLSPSALFCCKGFQSRNWYVSCEPLYDLHIKGSLTLETPFLHTVGDCYVAVCGLPDPRKDHALVMARFANDCLHRMKVLTGKLEKLLGPDTGYVDHSE